jgi:hypothetical protein
MWETRGRVVPKETEGSASVALQNAGSAKTDLVFGFSGPSEMIFGKTRSGECMGLRSQLNQGNDQNRSCEIGFKWERICWELMSRRAIRSRVLLPIEQTGYRRSWLPRNKERKRYQGA